MPLTVFICSSPLLLGHHCSFPANSSGDDIEVFADEERKEASTVFHTLRQQIVDPDADESAPCKALSDFVAPKESGVKYVPVLRNCDGSCRCAASPLAVVGFRRRADWFATRASSRDYLGAFAVAIFGTEERGKIFAEDYDDYSKILLQALSDRLAEALAEFVHHRMRKSIWGFAADEELSIPDMIKEKYVVRLCCVLSTLSVVGTGTAGAEVLGVGCCVVLTSTCAILDRPGMLASGPPLDTLRSPITPRSVRCGTCCRSKRRQASSSARVWP